MLSRQGRRRRNDRSREEALDSGPDWVMESRSGADSDWDLDLQALLQP